MNFANNIKAIRKEHSLSQEQLAEKLGVSRQSVSKWESNQSYPEMDKILLICKLFDCDIGELMSENIKEVSETKQSKNRANKAIEDFFDYISRLVEMFGAMSFKQRVKCIFEQLLNAAVLAIICAFIWLILAAILNGLFSFLDYPIRSSIENVIGSIYMAVSVVASLTVLLHIFKIRYLDYYEIAKPDSAEAVSEAAPETDETVESSDESTDSEETEATRRFLFNKKREKIIIRDPKHSSSKFLVAIAKAILFAIKLIVGFIGIFFAFSFVFLTATLILSFMFAKTGVLFVGILLGILALLAINYAILWLIYNFVTSKKTRKNVIALILVISLAASGVGAGLCFIGVTQFDIEKIPLTEQTEVTVAMKEDLAIEDSYRLPINYVEENRADVKISVTHSKYIDVYIDSDGKECFIYYTDDETTTFEHLRSIIEDINNKKINSDNFDFNVVEDITVYASPENIAKLKNNGTAQNNKEQQIYDLQAEIEALRNENSMLEIELYEKTAAIEDMKAQLLDLQQQMDQMYVE